MHSTSPSLLERLRGVEPDAWGRFVSLYTPLLFAWARRLGLGGADAEDLVQEVLTLLVKELPRFSYVADKRFRGWLWTITLNKFREGKRRRALTGQKLGQEFLVDVADDAAVDSPSELEYRQHLVQRALELMQTDFQPTTWKACWLQVVEGKSAGDAGAELGLSPESARVAKFRVLARLRRDLSGLLD